MEVIEQLAAVGLVLLLLAATLWALRRRGLLSVALSRKPGGRRMECIERLPLGPQQVLHLVQLDGRDLLIVCSPGGCRLLHRAPSGEDLR